MAKDKSEEIKPLTSAVPTVAPTAQTPSAAPVAPKSIEEERAELEQLRADLAAERKLLDEEMAAMEQSQQLAALAIKACESDLPPNRIHKRDIPKDVTNVKEWLEKIGKKIVVKTFEVHLFGPKGRNRRVENVIAVDESEAVSLAFERLRISDTQAYRPSAREIVA